MIDDHIPADPLGFDDLTVPRMENPALQTALQFLVDLLFSPETAGEGALPLNLTVMLRNNLGEGVYVIMGGGCNCKACILRAREALEYLANQPGIDDAEPGHFPQDDATVH